jgi:hypothetical protein
MASVPDGFFIHVFLDGDLGECTAVVATMAPNAPLLDPFFLYIGLAALRTHKDAFLKEDPTFFFHGTLNISVPTNMA